MIMALLRNSSPQALPKEVRATLATQYRLDDEALNRLRLLEKSGKYAGRRVRFIRIIDSSLLTTNPGSPLKYSTLDSGDFRNALRFEGHIEKGGLVVLSDRRSRQGEATGVSTR
jgi:hypothetical protein